MHRWRLITQAARALPRSRRHLAMVTAVAALLAVSGLIVPGLGGTRAVATSPGDLGAVATPGWISTGHEITVGGLRRGYLVLRPADSSTASTGSTRSAGSAASAALPVIVLLHGRFMTPGGMVRRSGLLRHRALLVVPAGYGRSWNAGACCAAARRAGVDDVAFVSDVVRQVLTDQAGIDPQTVYLAGYSNGGRMAYRLACRRPTMFAAVAAVEAVPMSPCPAVSRPVPLLVVASTGDPVLRQMPASPPHPIEGSPQPSVQDAVNTWRAVDRCTGRPSLRTEGTLTARSWLACSAPARVQFDLYRGGSHAWPTGDPATPAAQAEIWSFFLAGRPV